MAWLRMCVSVGRFEKRLLTAVGPIADRYICRPGLRGAVIALVAVNSGGFTLFFRRADH
jgi:hypothetical protein